MRAVSPIIFLLAVGTVQAQSFTVTSNADTNTAGTLRYAIGQANNYGAGATINFNSGLGTIQLTSALPTLPSNLTINGNGNTITGASGSDSSYMNTSNGPIFSGATPGFTTLTVASGNLTLNGITINGGNGGNDYEGVGALVSENLAGGTAIAFGSSGILSIGGSIAGGSGGYASANIGGDGGTGVLASSANASVQITGMVAGGNGGQAGSYAGNGGAAVQFTAFGSVTNSGTVSGGNGALGYGHPGSGGAGIIFSAGGSLTNSGTITGGSGNAGTTISPGSNGGNAVSFSGGGTVINSGTITGGAAGPADPGGSGNPAGAAGAAIAITGGIGTFTNMNHGVINGNVTLDNYANAVTLQIGSTINGSLTVGTSSSATLTLTDAGSGGSQNYSAAVSGTTTFNGQLIKAGTGTWVMDQAMSYAGGTTINAGTLSVSSDANLGASTGSLTLNGGTLQITGTSFTSTVRSINWGTNGGGFDINAANNTFTLTQTIANGGTLTKLGAGTLVLVGSADNAFLAAIVNAGTLVLGKASTSGIHAIGGGLTINAGGTAQLAGTGGDQIYDGTGVTLNGGTLDLNARTETISTLNGTSGSTVTNSNSAATGTLTVTGGGSYAGTFGTAGNGITLTVNGSGQTLTLSGTTDNGYLGVTVNAGTLILAKSSSSGVHAVGNGLTVNAGATVQLAGSGGDQIYDGTGVTLNGGTLDMNGRSETIAILNGSSGSTVTNTAGTGNPSTLTINGSGSYAGTIADGTSGGTMAIVKSASGTLTLSGNNTYSGGTTISGGVLLASNTIGSATGSGAVTVSNATLGGTGAIAGPITINSGGILAPGSGNAGTLTIKIGSGITFNAGSGFGVEISGDTGPAARGSGGSTAGSLPNPTTNNFLNNLAGTSSGLSLVSLIVNCNSTAFAVGSSYSYVIAGGMGNQSALNVTNPNAIYIFDLPANKYAVNASLTGDANGNVYLNFTVLPEPGLLGAMAVILLGLTRAKALSRRVMLTVLLLAAVPFTASAQTFTVTNTSSSGGGSFAAAITSANAYSGAATINFTSSLGTITLAGLPDLANSTGITINANGNPLTGTIVNDAGTLQFGDGTNASALTGAAGGLGATVSVAVTINNSATLNVQANATISGGNGGTGGAGAIGVNFTSGGMLSLNGGTITGGNGGNVTAGSGAGGAGATGVNFTSGGMLSLNGGTITGGNAGSGASGNGGNGGTGVNFTSNGTLTLNGGSITGGLGNDSAGAGSGGNGAAGVSFTASGMLTLNGGSITGGKAGISGIGNGGNGGDGVSFASGGILTLNAGTITGSKGNRGGSSNGNGGNGVSFAMGGSLINAGTIVGGLSGSGPGTAGTPGFGILFAGATGTFTNDSGGVVGEGVMMGNYANTVTLQTGSKIVGVLNIGTSTAATLTLTGSGSQNYYGEAAAVNGTTTFSGSLTMAGSGTWTMNTAMSYTGGTTLAAGTLSVSAENNLGDPSGSLTFNGGTLEVTGTTYTSTARTITWGASGGGFDINNAGNTFTLTQSLSNGGTLTNYGAGTLVLGGTADNVGLGVVVNAGTLVLAKSSSSSPNVHAVGGGGLTINGGTVQLAGTGGDQIYDGATVTMNGGTLDLNGRSETIGGLTGLSGASITNTAGTGNPSTLTINGSGSHAGTIADGSSGGTIAIVKSGSGTLTLSGANTYSGGTSITGGVFIASNTSGSATGGGTVTVTNATLGGSGLIAGPITFNGGGILVPGNPLTISSGITFNAGSSFGVEITSTAGPAAVSSGGSTSGSLSNPTTNNFLNNLGGICSGLNLMSVIVDCNSTAFAVGSSYSFVIAGGMGDQSALNVTNPSSFNIFDLPANDFAVNASLTGNATGNVYLNFTVLPEPGLLLGVSLLALIGLQFGRAMRFVPIF